MKLGLQNVKRWKGKVMTNSLRAVLVLFCLVSLASIGLAQAPVGSISGTVNDPSGGMIPNAKVIVTNKDTGLTRETGTSAAGLYSVPALPAGNYSVKAEAPSFATRERLATVEVGRTTQVSFALKVGGTAETVTVEEAAAQVEYETHSIDGVIQRTKIQDLPLNGRSFLNLASIEPGVRVGTGSTSQYNAQFNVSILGTDSGRTAITVDGGNIRDSIESTGSSQNFSQEVVQEFQISAVNFDLSTGITAVGSVNIVTRSGSNQIHGSGYFFFRDHNMAAYPALKRNSFNPDPFFARRNPGFWLGGPLKKDKAFFFFNLETQNQTATVTVQPNQPSVAGLAGNFGSPYRGKTLSQRFDYRINDKHTAFARYSHDGNSSYGPTGGAALPSNWVVNANWSDLTTFGLTSSLKSTLVNDFRFSYQYWHNRNLFPDSTRCPNCIGLEDIAAQIGIYQTNVTFGHTTNATQGRDLRKFQYNDTLTWQKGAHRFRFGAEYEHAPGTGFWGFCDPMCSVAFSPESVRASFAPFGAATAAGILAGYYPKLPTTINSYADILNLPFQYAVLGVGDPSQPPPYNVDVAKTNNRVRFFAQDTWRLKPSFTLNYGLAWEYESNLFNHDMSKPAILAPLYGSDLTPTNNNPHNFSPSLGFAWSPQKNNKTVIRGGLGIYYDTEYLFQRLQERAYIGPIGNGRLQIQNTNLVNTTPGIVDFSLPLQASGLPQNLAIGAPIPFGHLTNLTFGQFLTMYKAQIGPLTTALAPKNLNDLSVRNVDLSKTAALLYPKDYPPLEGIHMNLGFQRQITKDMVLSADFVRRVFLHVNLGALDYNQNFRYINNAAGTPTRTPVIPICTAAQLATPAFPCSNGTITFYTPGGRNVYTGLLVKLDKRFTNRYQFTASYALASGHGYGGIINNSQWNQSWQSEQARHTFNFVATVDLKWGFQIGFISAIVSRGPLNPTVSGPDLYGNGASTATALLPGFAYNCLNRGCSNDDLVSAVNNWNTSLAGTKDKRGSTIPSLILPSNYSLGRTFDSQDLRVTKSFTFKERYKIAVFAEMFNFLNYFNPGGISYSLDLKNANAAAQTFAFGQPTQRIGQVFGSGGPRALQIGGRFTF